MDMDRSTAMLRHILSDSTKKSFGKMTQAESGDYDEMAEWVKDKQAKGLIIDIPNDGIELS